jgi:hypothetical protein
MGEGHPDRFNGSTGIRRRSGKDEGFEVGGMRSPEPTHGKTNNGARNTGAISPLNPRNMAQHLKRVTLPICADLSL